MRRAMAMGRLHPFAAGLTVSLAAGLWLFPGILGPRVEQPIAFNHALHADEGLGCPDCHQTVLTARSAGYPELEVCLTCHEDPIGESPEEERLRGYLEAGQQVPWVRLFSQPRHVYYSHRRHAGLAGLECSTCHGNMGTSQAPPARRPAQLTMDDCIDCHEGSGVRTDCTVCHR